MRRVVWSTSEEEEIKLCFCGLRLHKKEKRDKATIHSVKQLKMYLITLNGDQRQMLFAYLTANLRLNWLQSAAEFNTHNVSNKCAEKFFSKVEHGKQGHRTITNQNE